jgi:DNA-binding SARP family transcriptional activator/tetratricopeptide (TPR) repeat protein
LLWRDQVLRIYTFGGLRIERRGQLVQLSPKKARDLLAYLITFRDRSHPRSVLAGALWPDLPEATARRRLSDTLWRVRRVLGSYVAANRETIGLDASAPHWLDVEEFELRMQEAAEKEQGDAADLPRLTSYTQLYLGPFLDGIYDDWVLLERERLRERWLILLEQLAHTYRASDLPEAAIETVRALLQADPWHEPGARLLMTLLASQGRAGEALQVYLDLCTSLQTDLGIAPTTETTSLYQQLRSAHPQTPAPVFSVLPHPPPTIRKRELAALETALQSARRDQGLLTLLSGPVGIGKTHLVQTAAAQARQMGFWTLYTHAEEPFGPPTPYSPLDQALQAGIKALGEPLSDFSPLGQAALSALLPDLVPSTPELDAARLPPASFHDALASALTSLADPGPLLLVLDDVHWADRAVWAVLRALLPRMAGCPLAVIATFRAAELPATIAPWPARLAAHSAVRSLSLSPLSPEDVGQLAAQMLGQPPPPTLAARIQQETGGNPLYVVETMRGLVEEGDLCPGPNGQPDWPSEEALPIPNSLHQAITSRVNRLTPQSQRLLHQAATLGDDFDFDLLWAVSGEEDEEQLLEQLDELLHRDLLVEADELYRFAHSLTRRVLYDEIHPRRRRIWHRKAAQALSHLAPQQMAARARHAYAAKEWAQALVLGLEAAEQSLALFAIEEAEAFYHLVHDAEQRLGDVAPALRVRRLRGLARVYRLRNEEEAEAQMLEEWRTIAHVVEDTISESLAVSELARNGCRRGHSVDALPLAQEAIQLAGSDASARATALEALGTCHEAQGALAKSLKFHRQAADAASQANAPQQEAESLNSLAIVLELGGEVAEAAKAYRRSAALAAACGDRLTESRAINNLGTIHVLQGDYGPAKLAYESALTAVQALESREGQAIVQRNLAEAWMIMGHPETARAHLDAALALHQQLDWPGEHAKALADLAGWAVTTDTPQDALDHLQQAWHTLPKQELQEEHLYYHYQSSLIHLSLKDSDTAAKQAAKLAQMADQVGIGWLEGKIALLDGKIAAAQGDTKAAERSLRHALQFCESQGYRADAASARAELGVVLQRAGQQAEAVELLSAAWEEMARRMLNLNLARLLERLGHPPAVPGQQETILPLIDAPLRRHPTADECATILWTPDAGPLEPPLRRQHLRRARLRRLLTEAAVQGAAPTIKHLAQAVNVSPATLNTDLAALRQEGWPTFTRGTLETVSG